MKNDNDKNLQKAKKLAFLQREPSIYQEYFKVSLSAMVAKTL